MRTFLSKLFRLTPAAPAPRVARPARLIIGLGNPGSRYAGTRHNVGFEVVDALASKLGADLSVHVDSSLYGSAEWASVALGLAKPQTFMNRSGAAVEGLMRRFELGVEDVLVVTDDLALPLGQIRLKQKGGAGGHNGLQDIAYALGSTVYPRLRIGIGNSFEAGAQVDYVLSQVPEDERPSFEAAVHRAAEAAQTFASDGLVAAMNRFN